MKKLTKTTLICTVLVLAFILSVCTDNNAESEIATVPIEQIQDNPQNYLGEVTISATVGMVTSREFIIRTAARDFEITVDYRGNQAFPHTGDIILIAGRLTENRPCCGPGFTLTSTQFEVVEQ